MYSVNCGKKNIHWVHFRPHTNAEPSARARPSVITTPLRPPATIPPRQCSDRNHGRIRARARGTECLREAVRPHWQRRNGGPRTSAPVNTTAAAAADNCAAETILLLLTRRRRCACTNKERWPTSRVAGLKKRRHCHHYFTTSPPCQPIAPLPQLHNTTALSH